MFEIGKLEEKFLLQVPDLIKQYHDDYNGEFGTLETNVEGMIKQYARLKDDSHYLFVQATENEKLIGFAEVCVNEDLVEEQKPILMIWDLRVDKNFRGKGIGTAIMQFIEQYGKEIDASFVFLGCDNDNKKARQFYRHLNYGEDFAFYKYLD